VLGKKKNENEMKSLNSGNPKPTKSNRDETKSSCHNKNTYRKKGEVRSQRKEENVIFFLEGHGAMIESIARRGKKKKRVISPYYCRHT